MVKKFISLILMISLFSITGGMIGVSNASEQRLPTPDTSWYNVNETSFTIYTAEQLAGLSVLVNSRIDFEGKVVTLGADIDLSDFGVNFNDGRGWISIGTGWGLNHLSSENMPISIVNNGDLTSSYVSGMPPAEPQISFNGTFNGNYRSITGLYINRSYVSDSEASGLFGRIRGGVVKNLSLVDVNVNGTTLVGGVAGELSGELYNVFVSGTISGVSFVGGLVGNLGSNGDSVIIASCFTGTINGNNNIGGLVGSIAIADIENSYSIATINGETNVGGLVGFVFSGNILNSYTVGEVNGETNVGGVAGEIGVDWNSIYFVSLFNVAALNSRVIGDANVGRIVGLNTNASVAMPSHPMNVNNLTTNYAFAKMTVIESDIDKTLNIGHDQIDGEDVSMEEALTADFWLNADNWHGDGWCAEAWIIEDGKLPILRNINDSQSGGDIAPPNPNEITVTLNGERVDFDVSPIIIDNRTLVPFRAIFEALDMEVEWDNDTRTAIGENDDVRIELPIDSTTAYINGEDVTLDAPAMLHNERTMVPLRFIAEATGADVEWDEDTRTVVISIN
ncbi:MAG: stalk domain-containing protein [Oscillospiraceae bacterium]|nr:stalk domain-containing protein [Oscillospiraceae bacterium]